ncbi:MAG: PAS domain S-box protein [Chloroflexi bacterium]|nr:PAS domain S-box protein [Chloroflexota bacterium]
MNKMDKKENRTMFLFIAIFFFLAIGIAAGGYISYRNFEREFRRQAEYQLSAVAELKMNDLAYWRKERMGDAMIIHNSPAFSALVGRFYKNPEDAESRAQLLSWLKTFQVYDQYEMMLLLDVSGENRLSFPATSEQVGPHLVEEAAASLQSGQVTFIDFQRETGPESAIRLSILVPIYDEQNNNQPLGVLVFRINPEVFLYPYISQWPTENITAETLLVRRDENSILYLNPLKFGTDKVLNFSIPLTKTDVLAVQAAKGQNGIVEGLDYRGVPSIGAVRTVPDSPWFLVSKMETSEVYAPLKTRLTQTLMIFGMAIVVAGAALLLVWRQQRFIYLQEQALIAAALHESDERFRNAFQYSSIGMALISPQGKWLKVNPRVCAIVGYSESELANSSFQDITHPNDLQTDLDQVQQMLAGEIQTYSMEKRYLHKAGQIVWVLLAVSLVKDDNGAPLYFISQIEDISERKQAEEEIRKLNAELEERVRERTAQLEITNKELEAFSYSVSHDLRAPLRGIDGWSQALKEDYQDQLDEQGQQYIERVRSETQRMGQLIDDMLQLSRLTRAEMRKEFVNLSALAQEIALRLQQDEPLRHVDFEIQAGLTGKGDLRLLEALLTNLLGNAFKFTGKRADARIEFGQTTAQGQSVFFIRDNGAGFDMAYSQKLFGAFQRMHKAQEFPGTGIGLATVQRIIHRHGGKIWAEAEVNRGATFYFTLG